MEIESRILQPNGSPYMMDARSVYSADPGFFRTESSTTKVSVAQTLKQPYLRHPWVYACVRAVMINLCRLTHKLYEVDSEENTLSTHPALTLLNRPNDMMTEAILWQAIVINLMLNTQSKNSTGGQCFLVPWDKKNDRQVDLDKGAIPDELMPFSTDFFRPWTEDASNGKQIVRGWIFSIPNKPGTDIHFTNNQIIRIYLYNPYDILQGMAPFFAAQLAVEQDVNADIYNAKLFANDARVAGLLSTDGVLSPQNAQENLKRWNESYGGPNNTNKTAILGNGLKYQQFGLSLADMQWTEQKRWNKTEILGAFGINKIGVGDYEQINYATIREGRKLLWYDTYIPIDELIWDAINNQWIRYLDNGKYRGYSDYQDVESLRVDMQQSAATAGTLVTQVGLPPTLACRLTGISLKREDVERWPYLDERLEPAIPAFSMPPDASPDKAASVAVVRGSTKGRTSEELQRLADEYGKAVLDPVEKTFISDMKRYFFAQRNGMMDKIDAWLKLVSKATAPYAASDFDGIYPNAMAEVEKLLKIYTPNAKKQMALEAAAIEKELGNLIDWNVTDQAAVEMAAKRKDDLSGINDTTFDSVKSQVSDEVQYAIDNNLSPAELARNLKDKIFDVYGSRVSNAAMIARTEMGIVASDTRFAAFKAEGIDRWQWATALDDRVRPTHMALEGSIAVVGQPFEMAGGGSFGLRYPRDTLGPLSEIVNCRCVALSYFED